MSKELEALNKIQHDFGQLKGRELVDCYELIFNGLKRLEAIDNANPSEALKDLKDLRDYLIRDRVNISSTKNYNAIEQALVKAQEQEKENEILKEIIKSLFDRGCPLHQYIDKDFGLTIEVDDECSIMILGEYKSVNLDKKLKEVLNNE